MKVEISRRCYHLLRNGKWGKMFVQSFKTESGDIKEIISLVEFGAKEQIKVL